MGTDAIELTTDNFDEEVLSSELPVVVDFWADWCGPCESLSPVLDELAETYDGRIKVAKVDIDANPHLANDHRIRALPTIIFFHKGHVLRRLTGNVSRSQLEEMFEQLTDVAQKDAA